MAELVNIGALSAFAVICLAILVLRRTRTDVPRSFRTPFVPFIPLIGMAFCLWLLSTLPPIAWERFALWMGLGLIVYGFYGRRHSRLAANGGDMANVL